MHKVNWYNMSCKRYIAYYIFGWGLVIIAILIALFGVLYAITDQGPEYGFSLAGVVGLVCLFISLFPLIPGIVLIIKGNKKKNTNQ